MKQVPFLKIFLSISLVSFIFEDLFKSILLYSFLTVFAFTQTAGKMGLFNKAYKFLYNMSTDASESDEVEQDDCYEDSDYDALLLAFQGGSETSKKSIGINSNQAFIQNHYSVPDSPPPDFI